MLQKCIYQSKLVKFQLETVERFSSQSREDFIFHGLEGLLRRIKVNEICPRDKRKINTDAFL